MELILITGDPERAMIAQDAGVDRIMVDLEVNGKQARQGHLDTVISYHTFEDLARVRSVLSTSQLLVRVNPIYAGSELEIERCLAYGADVLMLPMFTVQSEVARFIELVRDRALISLLLETPQALAAADEILDVPGIDEVHVGLNDLHLSLRLNFMFELLANGIVDRLAQQAHRRKLKFGFGGVARLRGGGLLSPMLILSEHVRLGSSQVILSRDFQSVFKGGGTNIGAEFAAEVATLRRELTRLNRASLDYLFENSLELKRIVSEIVESKRRAIV
jgi:2-keto-3-deoxy-L-rhamnonate aldolase RhmA